MASTKTFKFRGNWCRPDPAGLRLVTFQNALMSLQLDGGPKRFYNSGSSNVRLTITSPTGAIELCTLLPGTPTTYSPRTELVFANRATCSLSTTGNELSVVTDLN